MNLKEVEAYRRYKDNLMRHGYDTQAETSQNVDKYTAIDNDHNYLMKTAPVHNNDDMPQVNDTKTMNEPFVERKL